ncbi:hypothetical protein SYNPS1DRAFT_25607 [Syncephalis pseudoplumigaleata]|uniref:Uncharacterized protein n=1 Tax=Syncephalis pseudoplumigaleata TaxID=1712513 RepID=A0A4P9YSG1_9FUNG|nr:hypothetical protein SYNPS1DRAFT_25607 [Syncephalis pseudoplumigaleata]|eukprot:RKP22598.1 hypothetical protein SYNPS1DRAFT_25607 [Syncephalis pseudoplumigaleata]
MHVTLDLDELPSPLRRSLARWPRAQLPAVLVRLVELGLYQAVRPNDFHLRPAQLHEWLQQHQLKQGPRLSLNAYNTFVSPSAATWVACPAAASVQAESAPMPSGTDATRDAPSGFFSMLTAKLFGTRKAAMPAPAIVAATAEQPNTARSHDRKLRRKSRKQPSFSQPSIRNLPADLGSPSSQSEFPLLSR